MPIYIHPVPPPEPVLQAYFSGLEPGLARMLSIAGWGWHAEVGLHTIRLIANGVFDRHPNLHIIIGHMGEMIPFFLARINTVVTPFAKLEKEFADYFHSNIHITTSGIFTPPPFNLCLEVVGIDRILFSVDYWRRLPALYRESRQTGHYQYDLRQPDCAIRVRVTIAAEPK